MSTDFKSKQELKEFLMKKKDKSAQMLKLLTLIENSSDPIELDKIKLIYWKDIYL